MSNARELLKQQGKEDRGEQLHFSREVCLVESKQVVRGKADNVDSSSCTGNKQPSGLRYREWETSLRIPFKCWALRNDAIQLHSWPRYPVIPWAEPFDGAGVTIRHLWGPLELQHSWCPQESQSSLVRMQTHSGFQAGAGHWIRGGSREEEVVQDQFVSPSPAAGEGHHGVCHLLPRQSTGPSLL